MGDTHECSCKTPAPRAAAVDLDPFDEKFVAEILGGVRLTRPRRQRRKAQRRAAAATQPFSDAFPTPEYPPAEWFDGPPDWVEGWRAANGLGPSRDDNGILRLTVTDEGRIGGWFFEAGQCLVHDPTACPGTSPTAYSAFHQSDVVVDGGQAILCGVIGNTGGHASPWLDWKEAQRHYADPSCQMILCRAGDDQRGGWIAGALVPGLTFGDVALLRRSGLSGDWRPMPQSWWKQHGVTASAVREAEGYDCIGPTLVTRPALPLVKTFAASVGHGGAKLGGAAGIQLAPAALVAATPRLAGGTWDESLHPRDEHGRFGQGTGTAVHDPASDGVDVAKLLADNPQLPGEDDFVYQGRIVKQLDPQAQSDVLFALRERYEPVPYIVDGINKWCDDHGLQHPPTDLVMTPCDLAEGDAVARYFETTPDQSGDPKVQAAFDDFKRQNAEMFDYLTGDPATGGMGVDVEFVNKVDPYDSATAQAEDLRQNHHLFIESGLGGEHAATMTTEEYNQFRAVHDAFGHAGVGGGFDRHGEYEAWLLHSGMYTGAGRDAMSSEYHGINSALWAGEPGTPGAGKSILLPAQFSIPPWERHGVGLAAAVPAFVPEPWITQLIAALGLTPDFAQKFDDPPMHPAMLTDLQVVPDTRTAVFDESQHPRDERGRFGEGTGGALAKPTEGVNVFDDGTSLANRFIRGEQGLVLPVDEVATFTDRLAAFGQQEKEKGLGTRLNLCEVSVPGTNLFCGDNQGIPRQDMPQLKGQAIAGKPAASLPTDKNGDVDITADFVKSLTDKGVKTAPDTVKSESLKSTQNQLVGEKVAGIAGAIRDGKLDIEHGDRIIVSKDNYILDGHHRWAGAVLNDAEDGHLGDSTMPVTRVDMGILDLVKAANDYANIEGIAQQGMTRKAA